LVRTFRFLASLIALLLASSACLFGGSQTRTVLVDYSSDRYASSLFDYFPTEVEVHPGDTVLFRQTWTGEPHTVTGGHITDGLEKLIRPYLAKYATQGFAALPQQEPKDIEAAEHKIPELEGPNGDVSQRGAQPCFIDVGQPPSSPNTPCPKRAQPAFTGRQEVYSSGFIHYAGENGNTYRIPIAKDATPGRYYFFCTVHGPLMSGYIVVKPKGQSITSQAHVSDAADKQIMLWTKPLDDAWQVANAGKVVPPSDAKELAAPGSKYFKGILAGFGALPDAKLQFESSINEFIPRKVTAKVGAPVTWTTFGGHTISFDVPKYFPIVTVKADGTVIRNPQLDKPAGGAPPLPTVNENGPPGPPLKIDGGTYDGSHFWSSGVINTPDDQYAQYTLRFSRPGTYRYACLVHPPMVAEITITQ
jgi:plastocyanin